MLGLIANSSLLREVFKEASFVVNGLTSVFKLAKRERLRTEACEYLDMFAKKCGYAAETIDEMRLAFIEEVLN